MDRDVIFSPRFKSILGGSGVEMLLTAYQAPNMNAHAERFVRSTKSECIDQMIFLAGESLARAIAEYTAHYRDERSRQGIGNEIVSGAAPQSEGNVEVKERLGGLLKYLVSTDGVRWAAAVLCSDTTPSKMVTMSLPIPEGSVVFD